MRQQTIYDAGFRTARQGACGRIRDSAEAAWAAQ